MKKGFVVLGQSSHRKDALKVKWLHSLSLLYLFIQFCLVTKSVILVVGLFSFPLNKNTAGVFCESFYGKARINLCLSWSSFCVVILQSNNVGFVVFLKKHLAY